VACAVVVLVSSAVAAEKSAVRRMFVVRSVCWNVLERNDVGIRLFLGFVPEYSLPTILEWVANRFGVEYSVVALLVVTTQGHSSLVADARGQRKEQDAIGKTAQ
jgi:hypothetical protein